MKEKPVVLAGKEAAQFKTILRFYEHKQVRACIHQLHIQYKKGLKTTEAILKKYPNHGETTAMKGLFLSHLNRSAEAHVFIKQGLRLDLTSHICWHVYGLLHRAEKNYEEAIKCYHHALKYDKDNINIIRDYSLLLVQMRNYEQYVAIRHQLLKIKPNFKMYWIGLAVAYHLNNDFVMALKILDTFQSSQEKTADNYENSELLLYRNMILEESGDYKAALDHLRAIENDVKDRITFQEAKGIHSVFHLQLASSRISARMRPLAEFTTISCRTIQTLWNT